VHSTRVHVYTRASRTDILSRKSARVGQVGEDASSCVSGLWRRKSRSRTRRHPRDDPRSEVGEDARICVGVRVGPVESFQLNQLSTCLVSCLSRSLENNFRFRFLVLFMFCETFTLILLLNICWDGQKTAPERQTVNNQCILLDSGTCL